MGVGTIEHEAVFLDRDGVINRNVFYPSTGEWESPRKPEDLELIPGVLESLWKLQQHGYLLFLVSNQPSHAKGKASLESIKSTHDKLHSILRENSICFADYFYCYHHPKGVVPDLAVSCTCRKPGTSFLEEAKKKYSLNMSSSWMTGDRDSDIICGQKMGLRTILIRSGEESNSGRAGKSAPDFEAGSLAEAVSIIIRNSR
ncbi:MAG: HAD family hydrolase [Sedimentisphaerales bacterium]|nr:HAD family hydrolase [Sedimentisphaerales bacterium]